MATELDEVYIFADVAEKMNAHMRQQLADGAYDDLDLAALGLQITSDLHEVSKDLHIRVAPMPPQEMTATQEVDEAAVMARYLNRARRSNYGFHKMEILEGNVGYLELRGFADASIGGDTAIAAMGFLASSDALIIDLRQNGGGSPSMIQLISSYFFDDRQHLNSFYVRRGDITRQFWTHDHVSGERMVDTPIWVLTSGRTFSAAEEFSYNLKHMERATLVGETTGGGAHPVDVHRFPELGIQINLPFGRAVNPITGTNWEGTGVSPHVDVPADQALAVAHQQALEHLIEHAEDDDHRTDLDWAVTTRKAQANPLEISAEVLEGYVGVFGPRRITLDDGVLYYQRGERQRAVLYGIAEDLFGLTGTDRFPRAIRTG